MAIGATYFQNKDNQFIGRNFQGTVIRDFRPNEFLIQIPSGKNGMSNPPNGNISLAVTKSNKSNIPSPKMVNFLVTPRE